MPPLRTLVLAITALAGATFGLACESAEPSAAAVPARRAASAIDWAGRRAGATEAVQAEARRAAQTVTKDTWVLHIGDSFVHASLQQSLGPRFRATGANYVVDATTATYTTTWANDPELERWLARRPSLVLITLGANEVEMPVPEEHAAAVEQLVRKIAGAQASCAWITPPMWKKDTGILRVIHDHAPPCLFLDSDAVVGELDPAERQRDGIHPNERGGARWAAGVWDWLVEHRDATRPGFALRPFEIRGS